VERSFVWLSCLDNDSCDLTFRLGEVESHAFVAMVSILCFEYLLPGAGEILRTDNFPVIILSLPCVSSCHLIG
uniref:Uncharacterized protein n=1 Tax=Rhinopithecus bieti TaxID=61621 RepID=A0A2K6KWS4_RHIBE